MTKLANSTQISIARNALHSLYLAVHEARAGNGNSNSKSKLNALTAHLKAAETAMSTISGSAEYNSGIKAMKNEFERLDQTARELIPGLSVAANYQGQRRSLMTIAEKSRFISEKGQEEFLRLPN